MPASDKKRRLSDTQSTVLVTLGLLFVIGFGIGVSDDGWVMKFASQAPVGWIVLMAVVCGLSFVFGAYWMSGIDELAQRAHYEAWYWGGSLGLTVLIFVLLTAPALSRFVDLAPVADFFRPTTGDATGFMAGVVTSILVLMCGYGAWWLAFWLRKR